MKRKVFISSMMMLFMVTVIKRVEMIKQYKSKNLATELNVACADGCTCATTKTDCPCVQALRSGKSNKCDSTLCTNQKCPCGKKSATA